MRMQSPVLSTRIERAAPPAEVWQGFLDEAGEILDLFDASWYRGRFVIHGVAPGDQATVRQRVRPYTQFIRNRIVQDRFDDVIEVTSAPLRWSECARIEERVVCILSPWHIDNAYHLHANNLLPAFTNLWHGGLLDAPRVLYLLDGDPRRSANAASLWTLMASLFNGAVESVASLRATPGRIGFRHVRWGRGPHVLYLRDIRATPFGAAPDAYRAWALRTLQIPARAQAARARPRVLYLPRTEYPRRIVNEPLLYDAFKARGADLRVFSDWRGTSARDLVALVNDADVLCGVHGAALVHMAYLPKGAVVVELMTDDQRHVQVYPHMSHTFGHRHVRFDLTGRTGRDGWSLSPADASDVAARVLTAWEERHQAPPISVRALGTGNWGNEVFWYMFGKTYARRFGLELQTGPWAGTRLIGATDPPVTRDLPDVGEKTVHDRFDTIIPHGPPLAEVNCVGYFQYHTAHYRPDREYVQSLFQPAPEVAADLAPRWEALRARGTTVVALHIRRGDYGFSYFYRAPTQWYLDWLARVWPHLDRPVLYIASDDLDAVVPDFAQYHPVTARDLGPAWPTHDFYRDFYALQHSDILGISNSSFSFAAAMVNTRLQAAYRPHLPSASLVAFDPWDDKPLQQGRAFHVERYPWRPELWRPTPARQRWYRWGRHHAAPVRAWVALQWQRAGRVMRRTLRGGR